MEIITEKYLKENPLHVFVFGDNKLHRGRKGAARLRNMPNSYGFITKKYPSFDKEAYYKPAEYYGVYRKEMEKLVKNIRMNPGKTFLISKIGSALADRFGIFKRVIEPSIKSELAGLNVKFLW